MKRFVYFFFIFFSVNFYLCQGTEMPIIAIPGVPEGVSTTLKNYKKMKDAGFTVNHVAFSSLDEIIKALDVASKTNIKLLVYCWELQNNPEKIIPFIKNHKALYGYFIFDEVNPDQFNFVKNLYNKVTALDDKHIIYMNAYPNYVPLENIKNMSYREYLDNFVRSIPTKFISFDNYPLVNDTIRQDWYSNLEDVKTIADKYNLPIWAFACTAIHFSYLKPSLAGLRLQNYSNLLYGAKVLQYYTYWSYSDTQEWIKNNYKYAVVDKYGESTPTYTIVKKVNQEIQKLSWVFLQSKVDSIYHIGEIIPDGTKRMYFRPKNFKQFETFGKQALVSFLSNSKNKFLVIQNKSIFNDMLFEFQTEKNVRIINNTTGKLLPPDTKKKIKKIQPGDIMIFQIN